MVVKYSVTLLKKGKLLLHDSKNHVVPTRSDLLISNGLIKKIAPDIDPNSNEAQGAKVVDCSGKIISPGFVDTHHHLWQTQLKGLHADQTLIEYIPCGNATSSLYTPEDVFWGQLAGALEAIDAGITTVLDHAHCNITEKHGKQALCGSIASGIRSVYCYCPTIRTVSYNPFSGDPKNMTDPWVMSTFESLAAKAPFGPNGLVKLGFAFDGFFLPGEVLKGIYDRARKAGSHLITGHSAGGGRVGQPSPQIQLLSSIGALGKDVVLSHNQNPFPDDAKLLQQTGAHISTTPGTELQMSMGECVALRPEIYENASLGVDAQSITSSYMPYQMMLLLQHERAHRTYNLSRSVRDGSGSDKNLKYQPLSDPREEEEYIHAAKGYWARTLDSMHTVEKVFNLGTIRGAVAMGMADQIGRIAEGFKADLVVYDAQSPAMLAAAEQDPVGAIVLHSSVRDIDSVYIDGELRKSEGRLLDISVGPHPEIDIDTPGGMTFDGNEKTGKVLSWRDIAQRLLKSRERIVSEISQIDLKKAEEGVIDFYRVNKPGMV